MTIEKRRGHVIEIQSAQPTHADESLEAAPSPTAASSAADVLQINGNVVPYVATHEGIRIYYQPPANDLLSAARTYVDTQREKEE